MTLDLQLPVAHLPAGSAVGEENRGSEQPDHYKTVLNFMFDMALLHIQLLGSSWWSIRHCCRESLRNLFLLNHLSRYGTGNSSLPSARNLQSSWWSIRKLKNIN